MQNRISRFWEIMRFCIAGIAGLAAYYAALYGLTEYFGVWYVISSVIGSVLNTGLNFSLQKFWTFRNKGTEMIGRQLTLYVIMTISFSVSNTIILYLMVRYLHMWYIGAQMIITAIISILSFIICRKIFRNKSSDKTGL